ncbi:hypothetical protein B6C98_04190 [Gilliamella apis]|nr:hypothetical protein B6C98_04190 [Gilliamella apis]OTQ64101.1 hypothetical protein B6D09_07820 [Gilliamella apis]OTQ66718.1 hypothetical protein B6C89_07345 [Gilliamella apis]OTQ68839.1 hypothetical protein B6D10_06500 [Gilliamella apis]
MINSITKRIMTWVAKAMLWRQPSVPTGTGLFLRIGIFKIKNLRNGVFKAQKSRPSFSEIGFKGVIKT